MTNPLSALSESQRAQLKQSDFPDWTSPMLATLTHERFSDPEWLFERKLDGQRCLFFCHRGEVRLMSRNKKPQNSYYPELVKAFEKLEGDIIFDGEIVTFKDDITSFSALQNRMHVKNPSEETLKNYPVFAYLFDILYLDKYDTTQLPLTARKQLLKQVITYEDPLRFLPHQNEHGEKYLRAASEKGWEGLIAKRADSTYQHSRAQSWLKFKCAKGQEFVIAGFTEPQGERVGFGALLLGYYDQEEFRYAGRVGTGYDNAFLSTFREKMNRHTRKTYPFDVFDEDRQGVTWLSPYFVGEIGFTEWTSSGKLRHPRFLGLRKDKAPEDVIKEDNHAS